MSETAVEIVRPSDGQVTLTLSYEDAEILTRLIGRCNPGNLVAHSTTLYDAIHSLCEEFGEDDKDAANRFYSAVIGQQVYVYDISYNPF